MRDVRLRFGAGVAALALGLVAVAFVVVLAHRTPGPVAAASPSAPAVPGGTPSNGFPVPPQGAVVWAREAGPNVLALAVVPTTGQLQTSIVDGQGKGILGARVIYNIHDGGKLIQRAAMPCGAGCYGATVPLQRPTRIDVDVAGRATAVWRVAMPELWPPRDATALLAQAARTWRALKTLTIDDRLASDPNHAVTTVWHVVAPNRLAYQVEGGPAAVLIGDTRWDKQPGQDWVKSTALPVKQPQPFWTQASSAHVLESTSLHGQPVWRITFFDRRSPAWFEVLVAKSTLRTLDLRMRTTAHFMHEQYRGFDAPIAIDPPVSGS